MKMKFHRCLGVIVFMAIGNALALATPLQDKVDAFKVAIKNEPSSTAKAPSFPGGIVSGNQTPAQMLDQIASDDSGKMGGPLAIAAVRQIMSQYSSDAVQTAGQALLDEMEAEQKSEHDAYVAKVKDLLGRLSDVISKATDPADLDASIAELQKAQGGGGYGAYGSMRGIAPGMEDDDAKLPQEIAEAYQFATGWQDYLAHLHEGNVQQGQTHPPNLSMNVFGAPIVPRSHILALMDQPIAVPSPGATTSQASATTSDPEQSVAAFLSEIKTLDK